MYETYFNLTERPFASVPRSDHYYPAAVIDGSRRTLARCIDRGEGVAMIIGPSGMGKSLLCQVLAEQFQKTFQVALLASTHLDTRRSLLQAILYELSRPYRGMDEGELRLSLVDYITLSDDCNRGVVLLVDESHHLPLRLLDEIRSLTNLTRDMQPAVRMVLAGSHVLEERFASPKLESFSQRISARCYLEAFQRSETQAYIQSRISVCGGRGGEVFPAETCQMVHKATDGVPRLINQVCDHVLLLAYAAGIRQIEPAHVEEAWADLQQLPTPWTAPAAPSGDSVIEFGGLDDAPLELPPIAGKIAAAEDKGPAEAAVMQPTLVAETAVDATDDPQTFEQLRHIQKLLADVQAEFQPVATIGPEVELVFETPHPFTETFEEEEVIADRYAAVPPPLGASVPAATPVPEVSAVAIAAPATEAEPASTSECREEPQPATIPIDSCQAPAPCTHGGPDLHRTAARKEVRESEAAVAAVADEPSPRPTRSVVPPPRQQFGRLFAKLRRGL
jgi:type II secretory pathway predicted ATPase ExeA